MNESSGNKNNQFNAQMNNGPNSFGNAMMAFSNMMRGKKGGTINAKLVNVPVRIGSSRSL